MNQINIEFQNETKFPVTVILEFSTDEFVLQPNDKKRIFCKAEDDITLIQSTMINHENIVIWLPRSSNGKVYINENHVFSMAENFW